MAYGTNNNVALVKRVTCYQVKAKLSAGLRRLMYFKGGAIAGVV
jgi:hypothetical protein